MINQDEVIDMEKKSEGIERSAFEIRGKARQIEMDARKRRCRLYAAMAGVAVLVIMLIIIWSQS